MASSQSNRSSEHCSRQEEENLCTSPDLLALLFLCRLYQENKIAKLLPVLLLKYQEEEPVTKEEMLHSVDPRYHGHFPLLFKEACECLCLAFGIDVQELDPPGQIYVLLPVLGLSYKGILGDNYQSFSKVNLLIVILTVIFLKGNHVSEEDLREVLRTREMLPQKGHFVIGEPWEFITKDLVQLQYLEYRQVPHSNPAKYEFLWGPRTHAETTKMKVLEHLAKVSMRDPRSYTHLYAEALREEQEAAHSCAMGQ
ncbi:PREDICTED: melanoma-associated antigen 10-like [Chinchilla lanigera]|uniref:melanoma-associated antigen 10-like n=1 Tax=Chinchilla lanigera TaxID=34839 RepID=UPI00038EED8F|nr:PREDICTED: melanoma-associated antigen 10-like [Chinchilla lanigera]